MYAEITDDTDLSAEIASAAADATAAIRRLSELSRAGELADLVTALDALESADGPLAELGDLMTETAGWLVDFEDEETEAAADCMENTSGYADAVREGLDLTLRLIRPLVG